jgi:hypothetical protein
LFYLKWPFSKENSLTASGAAAFNVGTKNIGPVPLFL